MQDEIIENIVELTSNLKSSNPLQIKREVFKYRFFSLNIFACLSFVTQPT